MHKDSWLSIDEMLPDTYDDVLIANNEYVSVGWFEFDQPKKKWNIRTVQFLGDILFWQPLPEPPESK